MLLLALLAHAFEFGQILDARDGIAEHAVSIAEHGLRCKDFFSRSAKFTNYQLEASTGQRLVQPLSDGPTLQLVFLRTCQTGQPRTLIPM